MLADCELTWVSVILSKFSAIWERTWPNSNTVATFICEVFVVYLSLK